MVRPWIAWLLGAGVGVVWGCGDGSQTDECPVGSSGCACTMGGSCDGDLTCIVGVCVPIGDDTGGTESADAEGTSISASSATQTTTVGTGTDDVGDETVAPESSTADDGPKLDVGSDETGLPTSGCQRVDMLFVLDSSASMIEERQALAAMNAFTQIVDTLAGINGGGIQYRIGVTDDNDHGFFVPGGWAMADLWFDSEALTVDEMAAAFNGAVGQIANVGATPVGCEHVLSSAVDLLAGDPSGFVREDALLVLVLVTDVDDYGAYDQQGGNDCGLGCSTAPDPVDSLVTTLVDTVKGGQMDGVAAIVVAGDPTANDGLNICGQPGSCGCDQFDCAIFHADRLYDLTAALGTNGYAADLCDGDVPGAVQTALTESIDLACMNFEPEG